jgi:hypothetical protein
LATVVHLHVPPETMPPSSATLPMRTRLAYVFHLVQRKPFPAVRALRLVSSPVAGVSTSRYSKLVEHTTNIRLNATSTVHL